MRAYCLLSILICLFYGTTQALDIVKQAKVASILADGDRRKCSSTTGSTGKEKPSRRGSRESLDMTYDGEEVSKNTERKYRNKQIK